MENHNQNQAMEPEALLCDVPCGDTICITRTRYDELIRAEMEREILFHAYQLTSAFSMEPVMDAIFNPKFKYQREEAANSEAGAGNAE